MAKVIGIVGSPHDGGLTHTLVKAALNGARSEGCDTEIFHLANLEINPCEDCVGKKCWSEGKCKFDDDAAKIQNAIVESDGIVLGASVFFFNVNGLTKNFMDRMRLGDKVNGKPAVGITIAGGTGKGLVLALKTIYYFFFCVGLRGISPVPVSRFNFKQGIRQANRAGMELAKAAKNPLPFQNLAERIEWIQSLPYMRQDIVEENLFLARLVVENTTRVPQNEERLETARQHLIKAAQLMDSGKRNDACYDIMAAYEAGVEAWRIGRNASKSG